MISRSPFLNDLIEKINNNYEIDIFQLKNHIYELSIDQFGSRFIQQELDSINNYQPEYYDFPKSDSGGTEHNLKTFD